MQWLAKLRRLWFPTKAEREEDIERMQNELRELEEALEFAIRQKEIRERDAELKRLKKEVEDAKKAINDAIEAERPDGFPPSFPTWWLSVANQDKNLEDALECYVSEYHLCQKDDPEEPDSASIARAKLNVLNSNDIQFEGEDPKKLESYKMILWSLATIWLPRRIQPESKSSDKSESTPSSD